MYGILLVIKTTQFLGVNAEMKKVLLLGFAALLMILAACSDDEGQDSEVVAETTAGNVTQEEFYNELNELYGEEVLKIWSRVKS